MDAAKREATKRRTERGGTMSVHEAREDDIKPGDAVFFNTGWGSLWLKDNARYNRGEPGPGEEVARWMVERQIVVVGADSWAVEAVPNPDPKPVFSVHGELIAKNGIHIHENLVFDDLLADRKYQFVYIFCPVPMKGATGSPGGPIAVT
jgi:kynurenine formamidase